MLDEAIDYLKSLQLQLQVLNEIISDTQLLVTLNIYLFLSFSPASFHVLFIQPPDIMGAIVV